jgi:hypothetical protein
MTTKKRRRTATATTRGPELVNAAIHARRGDPRFQDRVFLSPQALSELGAHVPASLKAWLAFDTRSPNGEVSLVDGNRLALRSTKDLFEELVVSESAGEDWEEETRATMNELAETVPGQALLLREPCGQDHFLYLGKEGPRGEYVVLALEHEELWVACSGFDLYVAELLGFHGLGGDTKALCAEAAERILGE